METDSLNALLTAAAPELDVDIEAEALAHPHLPDRWLAAFFPGPLQGPLKVYEGSLAALAEADADFQLPATVHRILELAQQRHQEDADVAEAQPHAKDLFAAHAAFRADFETPAGWYRSGEPLGQSLWAVDLDVFLEVPLREKEWLDLRGHNFSLTLQGEVFEIELPKDAIMGEGWTLPGCGLFEMDAGVDLEELDEDDEVDGRFGDLHVFPLVL